VRDWEGPIACISFPQHTKDNKNRTLPSSSVKKKRHVPNLPQFYLFSFQMSDMAIEYKTKDIFENEITT
jgi:hypothetical protein